jgi:hypothetical protein
MKNCSRQLHFYSYFPIQNSNTKDDAKPKTNKAVSSAWHKAIVAHLFYKFNVKASLLKANEHRLSVMMLSYYELPAALCSMIMLQY